MRSNQYPTMKKVNSLQKRKSRILLPGTIKFPLQGELYSAIFFLQLVLLPSCETKCRNVARRKYV